MLKGGFDHWKQSHHAALAYIILCDQFSKVIYKSSAKAYTFDHFAQKLARSIIHDKSRFARYRLYERLTILLPLVNSEYLRDVQLAQATLNELNIDAENRFLKDAAEDIYYQCLNLIVKNSEILSKFGRYPQRNEVLGRKNKEMELDYLNR